MTIEKPPELAFREALAARGFWRDAVLHDPELGFVMLDESGTVLSMNDNAADILLGVTADQVIGRQLDELLRPEIARERVEFVRRVKESGRPLLVTSLYRGVRCRCVFRLLPGDAGLAGHVLWTLRRAPIAWEPAELHARLERLEAQALDWGPLAPLSDAERAVFRVLACGGSEPDAARRLEIPLETVRQAREKIGRALGSDNQAKWALFAIAAGLLVPERSNGGAE